MYPVKRPRSRKWLWFLLIPVILLAGITAGWFVNRTALNVEPLGDRELVLEYGEEYEEEGARVLLSGAYLWKDGIWLDVPLRISGVVDTSHPGSYTVVYSTGALWWNADARRNVAVVDSVPPIITLKENVNGSSAPGFGEPGEDFSASDNYDGDITAQVICWEAEGLIHYAVTDSSGNRTEVTRPAYYPDTVPPEVILKGEAQIRLLLGRPYEEPGFSATDDSDGDVTSCVEVIGSVDHNTPGTYTLLYRVSDCSGNETEVTRTVIVEAAAPIAEVVPEGKVIYLTFDDGPSIYTRRLLDVLRRYGIQATFFVTGNDPEIMAEIVNCGHAIGIHSESPNYGRIYASEEAFLQELYRSQQNIYDATGGMTTLLRFPGGSSNTVSRFNPGIMTTLTQSVEDRGFQYFDWNVDSNDAGGARDSDTVFENVVTGVQWQRVSIVLQHDTQDFSVDAVERIICWGLENGYRFLPLEPNSPGCHHEVNN